MLKSVDVLSRRAEEGKAVSTCGHLETAVAMTTVTVTVTPPACGPSPSTQQSTMVVRLCTTRAAPPPSHPPSAMGARGTLKLAWWVCEKECEWQRKREKEKESMCVWLTKFISLLSSVWVHWVHWVLRSVWFLSLNPTLKRQGCIMMWSFQPTFHCSVSLRDINYSLKTEYLSLIVCTLSLWLIEGLFYSLSFEQSPEMETRHSIYSLFQCMSAHSAEEKLWDETGEVISLWFHCGCDISGGYWGGRCVISYTSHFLTQCNKEHLGSSKYQALR